MEEAITYVGLDVHKETISIALAEGGARGEVRYFGKIANDGQALRKLAEKLSGQGRRLRFCASKIGSRRFLTAACTTRSVTVGGNFYRHCTGAGQLFASAGPWRSAARCARSPTAPG